MASKHYRHGGSSASRTMNCPGWRNLADTLPHRKESEYATIGSALHDIMESLLTAQTPLDPYDFVGAEIRGIHITADMIGDKVVPALTAWKELCERYDVQEYACEIQVEVSESIGGTADVIGRGPVNTVVADFKFGDGVMVFPEYNKQGQHYTLCGLNDPNTRDLFDGNDYITIAIIQPNTQGLDTLRTWETTVSSIKQFGVTYMMAVKMADEAGLGDLDMYAAGNHCQFCPCEPVCPIKTGLLSEYKRIPPDSKIPEQLADALDIASELESWINSVRRFAHEQMELGVKIPDYKLVNKRAMRTWNDEDAVLDFCRRSRKIKAGEELETKLKSPAQMEKFFKEKGLDFKKLETHVSSISSGTTLARVEDKRPEAPPLAALKDMKDRLAG